MGNRKAPQPPPKGAVKPEPSPPLPRKISGESHYAARDDMLLDILGSLRRGQVDIGNVIHEKIDAVCERLNAIEARLEEASDADNESSID